MGLVFALCWRTMIGFPVSVPVACPGNVLPGKNFSLFVKLKRLYQWEDGRRSSICLLL